MICPRCGYVRSEFDAHCLRCRILAAEGRAARPVPPAEQTVVMSDFQGPSGFLPPARPAFRLSTAWVIALLAIFALAAGIVAGRLTAAPHPQPSRLATSAPSQGG